ncbi:histidine kinase [Novosphingobium sp.]|uniref:ATP-binding protein n=1 Tax=Novosphingobium sp. TaxID=1874826 RepID=UPI00262B09EF|nr:histidine kinase [Novosphingobium sp.]
MATGRAVLALAFLVVLLVDPTAPVRSNVHGLGFPLISLYLTWAAALMIIAWQSWWFDYRLAPLALGIDIAVFLGAVYLTESRSSEFQSPFLAFAAFVLIAAMVRWNWRATALTAIVLLIANVLLGLMLYSFGFEVDPFRFFRRIFYIILLSSMLLWLSMSRGGERVQAMPEPPGVPGERRDLVFDSALTFVSSLLDAKRAAFAFAGSEEPWIDLRMLGPEGFTSRQLDPELFAEELLALHRTALFSTARQRELVQSEDGTLLIARAGAKSGAVCPQLAVHLGIDEGLVVPVHCATGSGQIIIWEAETLSFDDIRLFAAFGEEIGRALDREEMSRLARVEVETGVRQAVARDLHDSVAQFLAGTLFRLEALRRWIREGHDPDGEIDSIKNALRREQSQLRLLIERLRRGQESDRRTEITDELKALLAEAGAHWSITTELLSPDAPLPVSVQLSHEIRQLVREAIANAARHGQCKKVIVRIGHADGQLRLSISDDGIGFSEIAAARRPRSISERVEALGGQFELHSTSRGARLEILLKSGEMA